MFIMNVYHGIPVQPNLLDCVLHKMIICFTRDVFIDGNFVKIIASRCGYTGSSATPLDKFIFCSNLNSNFFLVDFRKWLGMAHAECRPVNATK